MAGTAADVSYWVGATSGDPSVGGNWATHAGTPTAPPAAGEGIRFDERTVAALDSGVATFFTNGKTFDKLTKTQGMIYDIGGNGDSVASQFDDVLINGTEGDVYLSYSVTGDIDIHGTGSGRVYLSGGTIAELIVDGPSAVHVGAGAVVTLFTVIDGELTLLDNATDVTTGNVDGGKVHCYREIDTADVSGTLVMHEDAAADALVTVRNGGVFNHRGGGTIANCIVKSGGTLSRKGATRDAIFTDATVQTGAMLLLNEAGVVTDINASGASSNAWTVQGSLSNTNTATGI